MNTATTATSSPRLRKVTNEIMEMLSEYPNEARDEVLDELVKCAAMDHELTSAEVAVVQTMIWARS
jgi:uncharacterized tellurite resistance protein B-like protein